ncbi:MAG: hypothetical protein F6J90_10225 [Moorea sp. SIOASIH]|nr:hypothetical protein [Moorena sp. SIOASIH]
MTSSIVGSVTDYRLPITDYRLPLGLPPDSKAIYFSSTLGKILIIMASKLNKT